jgi:hypothetical protein
MSSVEELAVEAVICEPVSGAIFPVSRENTGKFRRLRQLWRRAVARSPEFSTRCLSIPWQSKQGIPMTEQGIIEAYQGQMIAIIGNGRPRSSRDRVIRQHKHGQDFLVGKQERLLRDLESVRSLEIDHASAGISCGEILLPCADTAPGGKTAFSLAVSNRTTSRHQCL